MTETTSKIRHTGFTTSSSHLRRLKNGEDEAWREFYRKYRAMILAIGKKLRLPEKDSEDLMQEVASVCHRRLQTFIYDRDHCRFRTFLFRVTANLTYNLRRKNRKMIPLTFVPTEDPSAGPEAAFMREYEQLILDRSFLILKGSVDTETYSAFEMLFLENRPVPEVAAVTGKTANALYSVKHRCLKKLQKIITELQNELETRRDTDARPAPNTACR